MKVIVQDYNKSWPSHYQAIKSNIWPIVKAYAKSIEHVGSTSVIGLAAKPIIDIDIVISTYDNFTIIKKSLEKIGYEYRGDLGIKHRESFYIEDLKYPHHLYVCLDGSLALYNHLVLRDHLRSNIDDVNKYSNLKKMLASKYPNDINSYVEEKTDFILDILSNYQNFDSNGIKSIRNSNKK